jgi:hypothetical protein
MRMCRAGAIDAMSCRSREARVPRAKLRVGGDWIVHHRERLLDVAEPTMQTDRMIDRRRNDSLV